MAPTASERAFSIPVPSGTLRGDLALPAEPRGVVIFAHGSGSGRFSPRNRRVAEGFRDAGLGTLLLDLLTKDEQVEDAETARLRFDVPMLAERLAAAVDALRADEDAGGLPVGIYGASTGGGAALAAAALRPWDVHAVVSRGGRPDLAGDALEDVCAPALLVVGGLDTTVLRLNREAFARLRAERDLAVVEGATHLFEEPGALDEVTELAGGWFLRHLATPRGRREVGPDAAR